MVTFILPADDEHPRRPNLPILRHLTRDEIRAAQLGMAGLPIGAAYANGLTEVAVWFTLALLGIVFGISALLDETFSTDENDPSRASREIIATYPAYFLTSYFAWVAVGIWAAQVVFPPPTLPSVPGIAPVAVAVSLSALTAVVWRSV